MLVLLSRITKLGWKSFKRQTALSFATIFIMVMAISLVTSLFLLQKSSQFLIVSLQEKVDMYVYFNDISSQEQILGVKDALANLPEVKKVEYISKEEALQKFTQKHKEDRVIMESLTEVGGNPLLASLNIRAWEPTQYASIFEFLDNASFQNLIAKVDYNQKKPAIEKVFFLTSNINKIGVTFSIVFGLVAVLIAFNAVRLAIYNSKEEIETMRLVGASNLFIRGPFLVQGVIIGFLATLITFLIFGIAVLFLDPKLEILVSGLNLADYFFGNFFLVFLIQLAAGVGLGILSSWIAIRKYLKV